MQCSLTRTPSQMRAPTRWFAHNNFLNITYSLFCVRSQSQFHRDSKVLDVNVNSLKGCFFHVPNMATLVHLNYLSPIHVDSKVLVENLVRNLGLIIPIPSEAVAKVGAQLIKLTRIDFIVLDVFFTELVFHLSSLFVILLNGKFLCEQIIEKFL